VIIQNADYGISAEVTQMADGRWRVMLRDDDTGETVPAARIYASEGDALAYAEKICA
tara:strand:+ start:2774 stop:2944 length:171 start_codon:yes stop_codon:yes gene_type:complete